MSMPTSAILRPVPRLCLFLIVLLAAAPGLADPYRHTIVVDGVNDFTGGEAFATTTSGQEVYFTWDDTHLYVGCSGSTMDAMSVTEFIVLYFDTDPGSGLGASSGRILAVQEPAFLSDFRPDFMLTLSLDFSTLGFSAYAGAAWSPVTSGAVHAAGGGYLEMSIPLSDLGDPAALRTTFAVIVTDLFSEWTYVGAPETIFTDGYDPDYQDHLDFDFSSEFPPNYEPADTNLLIDPSLDGAGWTLTGLKEVRGRAGDSGLVGSSHQSNLTAQKSSRSTRKTLGMTIQSTAPCLISVSALRSCPVTRATPGNWPGVL